MRDTSETIKFPLYVRNASTNTSNLFVLAEAREFDLLPRLATSRGVSLGSNAKPLGEIVSCLTQPRTDGENIPEVLQLSGIGFIVVHRIPDPTPPRNSTSNKGT